MNNYHFFFILCLSFIVLTSSCGNNAKHSSFVTDNSQSKHILTIDEQSILTESVAKYFNAFQNKDYEYMIGRMYTPILTEYEEQNPEYSREELINELAKKMRQDISDMEDKGLNMTSVNYEKIGNSVINFENNLYTSIKYKTTMKYKKKKRNETRTIFAVSEDFGGSWMLIEDTDDSRSIFKDKLTDSLYNTLIQ